MMIWLWIVGYSTGVFVSLVLLLKIDADSDHDGEVNFFYSLIWPITWFVLISTVLLRATVYIIIRAAKWFAGVK